MKDKAPVSFELKGITFPKINALFIGGQMENDFDYAYRVEGLIVDDKTLRLLFGVQLSSKEILKDNTPKVQVTIESIAEFEYVQVLPGATHISQVPLAGNLLAMMYPFIREKVSYCFANNNRTLFLPPINTIQLIKEDTENQSFKITDMRASSKQQAEAANT